MFVFELDACDPEAAAAGRATLLAYLLRETTAESAGLAATETIYNELIANVYRHAARWARITVTWRRDGAPVLAVSDYGPGFDLSQWRPPAQLAEHGRGLLIVSKLANDVVISAGPEGCGARIEAVLPVRRRLHAA